MYGAFQIGFTGTCFPEKQSYLSMRTRNKY